MQNCFANQAEDFNTKNHVCRHFLAGPKRGELKKSRNRQAT